MERTLVILKPSAVQRRLIGTIISRFEQKGLLLVGMKLIQLDENILAQHYAHLLDKPFYPRIQASMMQGPVVVCCWEGEDAIHTVHAMAGPTNGRMAAPGTIRGDFSMSMQENIVHTSDSPESARSEIERFFSADELIAHRTVDFPFLYANDETND